MILLCHIIDKLVSMVSGFNVVKIIFST